jgi:hypothetical protein
MSGIGTHGVNFVLTADWGHQGHTSAYEVTRLADPEASHARLPVYIRS